MPNYKNFTEEQLIIKLKEGDEKAFNLLYLRYVPRLISFIRYFFRNQWEVDEIVQEIFIRIWEKRANINETYSFYAYLIQSVKNYVYSLYKAKLEEKSKINDAIELSFISTKATEADQMVQFKEFQSFTDREIAALPGIQREIFIMSRVDGLKNDEIARKLEISKRTVEHQIYRALLKLKKNLLLYQNFISLLVFSFPFL